MKTSFACISTFLRRRGFPKSPNGKPAQKTETKPNHPIACPSVKSPNALPGEVGQHDFTVFVKTAHLRNHVAAGVDAGRETKPRRTQNRMPLLDGPKSGHFGVNRVNAPPIGRGHGHDVGVQLAKTARQIREIVIVTNCTADIGIVHLCDFQRFVALRGWFPRDGFVLLVKV